MAGATQGYAQWVGIPGRRLDAIRASRAAVCLPSAIPAAHDASGLFARLAAVLCATVGMVVAARAAAWRAAAAAKACDALKQGCVEKARIVMESHLRGRSTETIAIAAAPVAAASPTRTAMESPAAPGVPSAGAASV